MLCYSGMLLCPVIDWLRPVSMACMSSLRMSGDKVQAAPTRVCNSSYEVGESSTHSLINLSRELVRSPISEAHNPRTYKNANRVDCLFIRRTYRAQEA